MNICIFISYHQSASLIQSRSLVPVYAGKALLQSNPFIIGDDCGENISEKYPFYKELTVLYNLWKTNTSDYKGLFHAHRLLNLKSREKKFHRVKKDFLNRYGLADDFLKNVCEKADIVLPQKSERIKNAFSLYESYQKKHIGSDLELCLQIIRKHYPDMYDTALTLLSEQRFYSGNVFIAKREIFDTYCQWLFTVLFAVERKIQSDVIKRAENQQPVYQFLSEILLNIYMTDLQRRNPDLRVVVYPDLCHEPSLKKWHQYCFKNFQHFLFKFQF